MPDTPITLRGFTDAHNASIDSLVAAFNDQAKDIVATASARTLAILQARLEIVKGEVAATAANAKVLRGLQDLFREQMQKAGYDALVDAYVRQFNTQFRYFDELLAIVAPGRTVEFTGDDKAWLAGLQSGSAESLKGVVDVAASLAQQRVSFNVGGMPIADLAEVLAERFQMTLSAAARIAETSVVVFYRSIAERGFADIEKGLAVGAVKYRYFGPDDLLTRRFCQQLVESGKTYTRAEIDLMDNHQFPVGTCMVTAGGWRCRHVWLVHGLAETPAPLAQAA
jgi:hypothetical protein